MKFIGTGIIQGRHFNFYFLVPKCLQVIQIITRRPGHIENFLFWWERGGQVGTNTVEYLYNLLKYL